MHTPPGLSRFHRTRPGARLSDRLPDHGCGDRSLLSPHRSVILAQEIVAVNAVVPLSHASVQPAPAASTLADSVGDAVRRYLETGEGAEKLAATPIIAVWPGVLALRIDSDCEHVVVFDEPDDAVCVEPQSAPPDAHNSEEDLAIVVRDNDLARERLRKERERLEEFASRRDLAVADMIALSRQMAESQAQLELAEREAAQHRRRIETQLLTLEFRPTTTQTTRNEIWMAIRDSGQTLAAGLAWTIRALAFALPLLVLVAIVVAWRRRSRRRKA